MNIYCIKSDFKEIFWNLQHMTEETRGSCWHQNFVPKELSAPSLGIYTCIKSWKKLYKIIQSVFLFVFLTCSKWSKWQEVSVDIKLLSLGPLGLSAPDLWLYTFIKSWKDVYKVRGWRDSFLNLQQMTIVMRPSCWHKIFGPNGLCAPYPKAMFKLLFLNNCWV